MLLMSSKSVTRFSPDLLCKASSIRDGVACRYTRHYEIAKRFISLHHSYSKEQIAPTNSNRSYKYFLGLGFVFSVVLWYNTYT